jgi:glycosyltransferase involved in cell wall biosynthesis
MLPLFRQSFAYRIIKFDISEKIKCDYIRLFAPFLLAGSLLSIVGFLLLKSRKSILALTKLYQARWKIRSGIIEKFVKKTFPLKDANIKKTMNRVYQKHLDMALLTSDTTKRLLKKPALQFPSLCIVLRSPEGHRKGILLLIYSYYFSFFQRVFDLQEIYKRYHIVLEPSWSGYFNLDILSYTLLDQPVFVEASEPVDFSFIRDLKTNLIPVNIGNNWWVDHRVFRPIESIRKDIDVIMIAAWARYKRHHKFFSVIRELKNRGKKIRVSLVGYPSEQKLEGIHYLAKFYEIDSQIEFHEWLSPAEVNYQLNRAKVNILWSRFEGFNRAIIEGMFAGVPCILRQGFNYGFSYPYINDSSGIYANETDLADKLLYMLENHDTFSPRDWVMGEMTCQKATEILNNAITGQENSKGQKYNGKLAVKVNGLHGMNYWDSDDNSRFQEDYDFLLRHNRFLK